MTNNALTLAYIGDAFYELAIRNFFIQKGFEKVGNLQKQVTLYVSAKGQASFLIKMLEEDFLTEKEIELVKRARNQKSHKSPKNTDVVTYKMAPGLEALIGYCYLKNQKKRLNEIIEFIVGEEYVCIW